MSKGGYDFTVIFSMEPFISNKRELYDGIVTSDVGLGMKIYYKNDPVVHITSLDRHELICNTLSKCTERTRLYLGAHGSFNKFAGMLPEDLAKRLCTIHGLSATKRIILAACNSAAPLMKNDFAKEFHTILAQLYNIRTEVVGYASPIAKRSGKTQFRDDDGGMNFFRDNKGNTVDGFGVKWIWRWEGGQQKVDFE